MTLFLGGKQAQLMEYRGHTRGDTVVLFPHARVLVMGDLLTTVDDNPPDRELRRWRQLG